MRRKKSVTLEHIANRVGVSKVTVSKALNNKEGVSEELKAKIWETAQEIGYKFSANKETEKSKHIGIILLEKYVLGAGQSTFYLKFYQELSIKLNQRGYMCNLFTVTQNDTEKNMLPPMLAETALNGIIAVGNMDKEYIKTLQSLNVPIVFLDSYYADVDMDCIGTDNYYSTYEITNHLLRNGHKKIAFVGFAGATSSIKDRLLGYCRSLLEAKIDVRKDWIIPDRNEKDEWIDIVLPEEMPTAFVCNCDDTAYKLLTVLKEKGYNVPEDISIVGFDDDIYAEICVPQLTTVAVDRDAMTTKAIETLISRIQGGTLRNKHQKIFIAGNVIYRESVSKI